MGGRHTVGRTGREKPKKVNTSRHSHGHGRQGGGWEEGEIGDICKKKKNRCSIPPLSSPTPGLLILDTHTQPLHTQSSRGPEDSGMFQWPQHMGFRLSGGPE